ncbi:hypothetical protein FOCC_FOCC017863 [Frankliniella occidentalis]|nr:hypothetical protein FOCC_FOCC017863 [Frankliniella occidentalis]
MIIKNGSRICVYQKEKRIWSPMFICRKRHKASRKHRSKQGPPKSVNTVRAEYTQHGCNHTEGGWPRDINIADLEQTQRFRKKVEKDDSYINTVLQLSNSMEFCILQNNAFNIYEMYFDDLESGCLVDKSSARTVNMYRDPCPIKRPVTHVSWSPDGGSRIAVTHCNFDFQRAPSDLSTASYIWEVENPNKPEHTFQWPVAMSCLEYSPKDPHSLVSGLLSGQVACWDTRRGAEPVDVSVLETSHRDPVHNCIWINSKSGTEFFSSSMDGQVKWWDTRKMEEPLETLVLDANKDEQLLSRAMGASSLEYEPTIPTRFMVGTENGMVLACNRKGKTPAEKMSMQFKAHPGPVVALQRNPGFIKNFLYHPALLTDGCWSPTKLSVFFTTRMDGVLDVWDILQQQREPCLSIKVCDEALRCMRVHEVGQLAAIGNDKGNVCLIEFSENLAVTNKNDKTLLTHMFERESRRERILEGKSREQRLKAKVHGSETAVKGPKTNQSAEFRAQAERDFFAIVNKEIQQMAQASENMPTPLDQADMGMAEDGAAGRKASVAGLPAGSRRASSEAPGGASPRGRRASDAIGGSPKGSLRPEDVAGGAGSRAVSQSSESQASQKASPEASLQAPEAGASAPASPRPSQAEDGASPGQQSKRSSKS